MSTGLTTKFGIALQPDFDTMPGVAQAGRIFQSVAIESVSMPGDPYDYIDNQGQSRGIHNRASLQQSLPSISGFLSRITGQSGLYMNGLVAMLYAMGFSKTGEPTGTNPYTWELVKDDVCDARWSSFFLSTPTCDDANNTHVIKKLMWQARMTQLVLNLSTTGGNISWTGAALREGVSATPTTMRNDSLFSLSPVTGLLSFPSILGASSGGEIINAPMSHTITINRPVEEDDQKMHTLWRGGAVESGFEIMGSMTGLDMTMELYTFLVLTGGAGTVPGTAIRTSPMQLILTDGQSSNTQSLQIDITKAQCTFSGFTASGADKVRCNVDWKAVDDTAADPVTFTVINSADDYGEDFVEV